MTEKTNTDPSFFNNHHLLKSLSEEELICMKENTHIAVFNKGETIIKQGNLTTSAVFVRYGVVKLSFEYLSNENILGLIPLGNFAVLSLILSNKSHQVTITALNRVEVVFVDIQVLRELVANNGHFAQDIMTYCSSQFWTTIQKLFYINKSNIHGRVAKVLLHLSDNVFRSKIFDILISRYELAQLAGVSRENVIKVMSEMKADGIINSDTKIVEIISRESIQKLADCG